MDATETDLACLLEMQQIDLEIIRLNKELANLPQRKVIVTLREKKRTVTEKSERVAAMKKDVNARLSRVSDEDDSLAAKQRAAQEAIDNTHGDYRNIEARTKEMNGYAKRRATLEGDIEKLSAELAKIEEIEAQAALLLESVTEQESQACDSFQKQGRTLQNEIAVKRAQKEKLSRALPSELASAYEKTAARAGGVAIGRLTDGKCGACRATIDGGRLIDLKSQAPLGICPACKRLLII